MRVAFNRYFSNFAESTFAFQIPAWLLQMTDATFPAEVHCEFSEKAIMLCKAVAMGDMPSFGKIAAAKHPWMAKQLGRMVHPWREDVWQSVVCGIAREVCYQKFKQWPNALKKLLRTGHKLVAEVTRTDQVLSDVTRGVYPAHL